MNTIQPGLILIVDDNPTNVKVLFDILKASGFRVLLAQDGEAALETLETVTPNLILLDVMMPGIDGFETCRRIKLMPTIQQVPVVFMTALSDTEDKVKGLSLGAVDYITKPFQQEEVLARIDTHLQLHYLTQELRQLNLSLEERVTERTTELSAALEKLKQSQLQLVQSEKMSALGQLVAGVAHEINNPVGFIRGNLDHAIRNFQDLIQHLRLHQSQTSPEKIATHAQEIDLEYLLTDLPQLLSSMRIGIDRIASISIALRIFSRLDDAKRLPFNIHESIDSTLLILKHRLKGNSQRPEIQIICHYGELPLIECFPGQLNQVFMNLLSNAIDALDEASATRSFAAMEANPNWIKIQTDVADNQIRISIQDNGPGIPTEIQPKIFNYQFTTKPVGKGTGLGLAIAHQIIVKRHGGTLEVFSEPKQGAAFVVALPLSSTALSIA